MTFDPLVLPFDIGLAFVLAVLAVKYFVWIRRLPPAKQPVRGWRRLKAIGAACGEIFMESLVHRKVFKKNLVLGYMHMSIAFGWFLLIVFGSLEARTVNPNALVPPHFSIFLNYFVPDRSGYFAHGFFAVAMDLLLAFILSGLLLAFVKRMIKSIFGMRRTSKLRGIDRVSMYALWLVFPLRLAAESLNAAVHGTGGFLTRPVGSLLGSILPAADVEYGAWMAYSLSLGVFFATLPWSRYSHIPTEMVLIFVRRLGYSSCPRPSGYTMFDLYSCSRCGICIDKCQINLVSADKNRTVSAHYIYDMRVGIENDFGLFSCLSCGRCERTCPVGVKTVDSRIGGRFWQGANFRLAHSFAAAPAAPAAAAEAAPRVAYFSGCMGKLTPGVTAAMEAIFAHAGARHTHIDAQQGICCGRPLMLAGQLEQAADLVERNRRLIKESGATLLVTSCPICLKAFRENYGLDIEALHHTEYIARLLEQGKLAVTRGEQLVAYHDPCELSYGLGVTAAPRDVVRSVATLLESPDEADRDLCCGGSLAGIALSQAQKQTIARDAARRVTGGKAHVLATACPMCKKSFAQTREATVLDVAEIVAQRLAPKNGGQSAEADARARQHKAQPTPA